MLTPGDLGRPYGVLFCDIVGSKCAASAIEKPHAERKSLDHGSNFWENVEVR